MAEVVAPISFENTEIAFSYKSDYELKKAAWLFSLMNNNILVKIGTRLTPIAFQLKLPITRLVRATIFDQFCGGETLEQCVPTTKKLAQHHVETILDYGVEAKETEQEFNKTVTEILKAFRFAQQNKHVPFVSIKVTGIAPFSLLEKIHAQIKLSDKEIFQWNLVKERMHKICNAALNAGIGVMVDAEETWIQDPVDSLAMEMMLSYNKEHPIVYNTIQLYRIDRLDFLRKSFETSKNGKFILAVKLVRGAYMEKERKRAHEKNYASPVQSKKEDSDRDYNAAVEFCFEHIDHLSFCVASHNEESALAAVNIAGQKNLSPDHPHLFFSQLYGMSDNMTFNLAHAGYNVSKYVPYGPVKEVVPYLMRRAQENTSVGGMSSRELMLIKKELKRRKYV
ncbi:MAG: proline dehydrogenase family protein [Chitinophagales bacterium]|nr:proline dehydrogenase family protein [Chitinophagales bacterium]